MISLFRNSRTIECLAVGRDAKPPIAHYISEYPRADLIAKGEVFGGRLLELEPLAAVIREGSKYSFLGRTMQTTQGSNSDQNTERRPAHTRYYNSRRFIWPTAYATALAVSAM
jgi:hypothetical protein